MPFCEPAEFARISVWVYHRASPPGGGEATEVIQEYQRDAAHRLKVAIGHLGAVERMVAEERYCVDIMRQVAAVQANLESVQQVLLKNHLSTCVSDAILRGSGETLIDELVTVLRFTKGIVPVNPDESDGLSRACGHHSHAPPVDHPQGAPRETG